MGLPGSGKSTVGPLLASRLGWDFLDFDLLIEKETGLTVHEIFTRDGEAEFRRLETRLTARLASVPRVVLAPGGGWILRNQLPDARMVWLQVTPHEAKGRMGEGADERPLLQRFSLEQLLAEREVYYRRADIHIDTSGKTPDEIADEIVSAVQE